MYSPLDQIIIDALNHTKSIVDGFARPTYCVEHTLDIMDVNPWELTQFMQDNNVPEDAEFSGKDNGYDGYSSFELSWYTKHPVNDENFRKYKSRHFRTKSQIKFRQDCFAAGYEFVPREARDTSAFRDLDLYSYTCAEMWDYILPYYRLFFTEK